jgi:glyoxylase-like metal-dependent hydrolase (beta-lactamase superfamily II)
MSGKKRNIIDSTGVEFYSSGKNFIARTFGVLITCSVLFTTSMFAQPVTPFPASKLVKTGDNVKYGSYIVYKIGEGIYKINDPGVLTGKFGAFGVDMYLICGKDKALLIDLGNNYMDGYEKDLLEKRKNAKDEFLSVVDGLVGKLPLEIAISHMHPDHDGMTGALLERKVTFWAGDGENLTMLTTQFNLDPSIYKTFKHGEKKFDLGDGRIVETLLLRGHSNGGTVYILKKDGMIFTLDAYGNGVGQTFSAAANFNIFLEDSQKLTDYINTNFTPYERYALKVFVGHTWLNPSSPYYSPNREKVDVGYLDWRYVQNLLSCAKGIKEGKWLVEGSGLLYVGKMPLVDFWPSVVGRAIMVYGTGTIVLPIELAYELAGLKMPEAAIK